MRALFFPRRRRGKRSVPLAERPLPSWPPAQDPWLDTSVTQVIDPQWLLPRETHHG